MLNTVDDDTVRRRIAGRSLLRKLVAVGRYTDGVPGTNAKTITIKTVVAGLLLLAAAGCATDFDAAEFGVLQAETAQLAEQNAKLTERIETLESEQADITDKLTASAAKLDEQNAENERLELCAATYADLAWSDSTALAANNGLWRFHMWAGTEYFEDLLADMPNAWTVDDLLDRDDLADSSYEHAYEVAEEHNCEHIDSEHYFWFDPAE